MKTQEYQDNYTMKQSNYLELYNTTIMKNLFDTVSEELESSGVDPLTRQGSILGSPRGPAKGGSCKRNIIHKKNRTHRK